ncbi:MAG: lipid-A-disaccharide synthase, partial [Verrucomicrobiota bacterium]
MSADSKRSVLVIAGEISGDMHLANVVQAIKAQDPDTRFWGIA